MIPTDKHADIKPVTDRGETLSAFEPLLLSAGSRHRKPLADLALELTAASTGLKRSLPAGVVMALSALVRSMNCYYSNLIEGHDTHPVDIERAMRDDYSADSRKRDLQLEARAHVAVQAWIDEGALRGRAFTVDALCEVHLRFGELLPPELLVVRNPETQEEAAVVPGELRRRDVKVGQHVPASPGAVPRFLARYVEVYGQLGRAETILAAAGAHHRLLWIHPFVDGNGRVARLLSHAVLLETLDTGALWSVARGLARRDADNKAHLVACDGSRRSDLDGRGALSEEALAAFTTFFLEVCLDQVRFMESLVEPGRLRERILRWAAEESRRGALPAQAGQLLEAVLFRGELPRGDVASLLGTGERNARRVMSALLAAGVLASDSPRESLRLAFPATLAGQWMPGLFPDQRR